MMVEQELHITSVGKLQQSISGRQAWVKHGQDPWRFSGVTDNASEKQTLFKNDRIFERSTLSHRRTKMFLLGFAQEWRRRTTDITDRDTESDSRDQTAGDATVHHLRQDRTQRK